MLTIKELYSSYYDRLSEYYPTCDIYLSLWNSDGMYCEAGNCRIGKEKCSCASVSKLFVFLAFGIAEKQQLISVDTTVGKMIPELRLYYSGENMANSITIGMLLRHSSGLPQFATVGNVFIPENDLKQHIFSLDESELLFDPGCDSCYSNLNYDLLSYILELVFECPYERILSDYVFSMFSEKPNYGFIVNNKSQTASLGMELSPYSLMYTVSKAFGSLQDHFFSEHIRQEYSHYVQLDDNQYYGQGLCCKVFMISGIPCCYVTGQFMDRYICLSWNSEKDIYHLFFATKCSKGLINYYHENDLFCRLLVPEWPLNFDVPKQKKEQEQYYSVKDRFKVFERYVSCDNQILEILKRNNSIIVFHNMHFIGNFDLDFGDLIDEEIMIKRIERNNNESLLAVFNGEVRYYYKDYASLGDNNVFYRYEPIISEYVDPMDRFFLRFLRNNTRVFISLTDEELVINNLFHYRRHHGKYYSSAGAVAFVKGDEIYINNLAFAKKIKVNFEIGMIRNIIRI